jgi:hypothetical protein
MTDKPNLTRVWAGTAPGGNVVDPDTVTAGKFAAGWQAEVPPFEYFNFIQKTQTQGLAHINEQGIAVWDDVTTYPVGGLAKGSDGNVYKALVSQSDNDPVTDGGTNWIDWEVSNRVIRVTSIADMEAYSAPVGYVFSLNAGGRSGDFDVITGDFSTELAADTLNGIYVGLADNPTATTKVAKRRFSNFLNVRWLGAIGNGVADDTAYINEAISNPLFPSVLIPSGVFIIVPTSPILIKSNKYVTCEVDGIVKVSADTGRWNSFVTSDLSDGYFKNVVFEKFNFDSNIENNTGGQGLDGSDNRQYVFYYLQDSNPTANVRFIGCNIKSSARNTIVVNALNAEQVYIEENIIVHRTKNVDTFEDNSVLYINTSDHFIRNNIITSGDLKSECAIETHKGPAVVTGNILKGFEVGVNLTGKSPTDLESESGAIILSHNIMDCDSGVVLWSFSPLTGDRWNFDNTTVSYNTMIVSNIGVSMRFMATDVGYRSGNFRNLTISNNKIIYPDSPRAESENVGALTGAIVLGTLSNVYYANIENNVITNSPFNGISIPSFDFSKTGIVARNNTFNNPCIGPLDSPEPYKNCFYFDKSVEIQIEGTVINTTEESEGYSYYAPSNFIGKAIFINNQSPINLKVRVSSVPMEKIVKNDRNPLFQNFTYASSYVEITGYFYKGDYVYVDIGDLYIARSPGGVGDYYDSISGSLVKNAAGELTYSDCENIPVGTTVKIVETGKITTAVNNYKGGLILDSGVAAALATGTYTIVMYKPVFSKVSEATP